LQNHRTYNLATALQPHTSVIYIYTRI
jgi:hypothetical protein